MLSNNEKMLILEKRLIDLEHIYSSLLQYIQKIEDGMQDPDMTISECNEVLPKIQAKIDAINAEKQALTNT